MRRYARESGGRTGDGGAETSGDPHRLLWTVPTSTHLASTPYVHELTVRGRPATRPTPLFHLVVEAVAAVAWPGARWPVPVMKGSRRRLGAFVIFRKMPEQVRIGDHHYFSNEAQAGVIPLLCSVLRARGGNLNARNQPAWVSPLEPEMEP